MNSTVRIKLSVMMFIQFFVWGAWFVTLGTYLINGLQFDGKAVGSAYSTTNWAAIISPFFIGMIADRFFSAERVMGVLHLIGAGILLYLAQVTTPGMFFVVALAYALCYMPTLSLVNAISFQQMSDPAKQFPGVRVWGTFGWIAAGLLVGYLDVAKEAVPLKIAAGASLLMGLYSFALPHTPPKSRGKKVTVNDVLSLDALRLMKDRSFAIFVFSSLLICIPLAFYYNFTNPFLEAQNIANAAGKQTMGQMSEVFFMLVMPFCFFRLGVKKMLLVGMAAWAIRYFLFAYGNNNPIQAPFTADSLITSLFMVSLYYAGILLHGICYDFFFVTGQLYVDKKAPADLRATAQGFIGLVTYGAGMAIGSVASGFIVEMYKLPESGGAAAYNWPQIWLVPGIMAVVITILFALVFRDNGTQKANDSAA
jgi:nucleoside transporter